MRSIKDKEIIERIKRFKDMYGIDFTDLDMHDKEDVIRDLEELGNECSSLVMDLEE